MRQLTLATVNFDKPHKQTRRAAFLAEMIQVVPWRELCALIEPFYPETNEFCPMIGRPPIFQRSRSPKRLIGVAPDADP